MSEFKPGIHFGMPEAEYHAVPALSASGIKLLRISSLEYWMQSFMNPDRDALETETDSFAKTLGSAYHKRICEGRAAFEAAYAPKIDASEYPDALDTADDLKAVLRQYNEVADEKVKLGGSKAELAERVLSLNPAAKIWSVIQESYFAEHQGKTFLPWKYLQRIETAAKMIEADPHLGKAFQGGASEVSILWECPTHGVPMKIRVDYLKPKAIIELKSFGNPNGRPIDRAIGTAFASRRYHIAAALYWQGVSEIHGLMEAGKVYGDAPHSLLSGLHVNHEKTYMMVWQHSGIAPIVRGKVLPTQSIYFRAGETEVDVAKMAYRTCMEKFGPDTPWIDAAPIEAFDDNEIPSYGLE